MKTTIIINPRDNVAVALEDLGQGGEARAASGEAFRTTEKIPYSHKVALREIRQGEAVIKYGEVIGTLNPVIESDKIHGGRVLSPI